MMQKCNRQPNRAPVSRRAVIDIGTNSVKLLIADVAGRSVTPVLEKSHQTRLGAGFYVDHVLKPDRIEASAQAVAEFVAEARNQSPESLAIIATSAARDALNQADLLRAVEASAGMPVRVLSGEEEAQWAFQGAVTDPAYGNLPVLLVEVGGGSTQFIAGHGERLEFRMSSRLGTVRLLEHFPPSDPPTPLEFEACSAHVLDFLRREVQPQVPEAIGRVWGGGPAWLLAAGGTASVLGCIEIGLDHFDREALEEVRLTAERLREWETRLWSLPLEERRALRGLPPNRAEVILMGVLAYRSLCDVFGFSEMRITTRGLRFAALLQSSQIK